MRRSKLELHVDILKVLARHGPLKLTHIMYKANVNCGSLKQYLDFLIQHNLVREQTLHKKRHKTKVFYAITERGQTVLLIEHNLDVIKTADYIIDLGPEGGDKGGKVIAEGTPEAVAKVKGSYTGKWLAKILK